MPDMLVPLEDFDIMMCPKCTCEQFRLLALSDGDEAIALVAECDECGHREQLLVAEDEDDA